MINYGVFRQVSVEKTAADVRSTHSKFRPMHSEWRREESTYSSQQRQPVSVSVLCFVCSWLRLVTADVLHLDETKCSPFTFLRLFSVYSRYLGSLGQILVLVKCIRSNRSQLGYFYFA